MSKDSDALFMQLRHGEFGVSALSDLARTNKQVLSRFNLAADLLKEPKI